MAASFSHRENAMGSRVLVWFLIYGIAVGLLSVWWWQISDNVLLPNIPGMVLGDQAYVWSIEYLGDPGSSQAHFTIPWILRIPQVYVPASVLFWGLIGLVLQNVKSRK